MPNYRRRISEKQRKAMIAVQDYYRALQARRERLINYLFFGKPLVVTSIWLRVVYILFFAWTGFFDGQPGSTREEVVQSCSSYIMYVGAKNRTTVYVINFSTNFRAYEARKDDGALNCMNIGDTLDIQYTAFGKPSSFKGLHSEVKQDVWINWVAIVFVGFLTLASFAAFQGYDYTTNIVIVFACIADIIIWVYYFVYC